MYQVNCFLSKPLLGETTIKIVIQKHALDVLAGGMGMNEAHRFISRSFVALKIGKHFLAIHAGLRWRPVDSGCHPLGVSWRAQIANRVCK